MKKRKKLKLMKFERKSMPLLPFDQFLIRELKYFLFSSVLIVLSLAMGTFGYHYLGELAYLDAFYNSSLILAGMGPVDLIKSDAGKLFASFYALFSGIAFLSLVAVIFAPIAHRFLHILHLESDDKS